MWHIGYKQEKPGERFAQRIVHTHATQNRDPSNAQLFESSKSSPDACSTGYTSGNVNGLICLESLPRYVATVQRWLTKQLIVPKPNGFPSKQLACGDSDTRMKDYVM
jgi:hypothetical protein